MIVRTTLSILAVLVLVATAQAYTHITPPASNVGDRGIFGAIDRDGYDLGGAIAGGERVGIGERLAHIERLHRGMRIVQRVGPGARGETEIAVAIVAECARFVREADRVIRGVDVRDGERAIDR